MSSGWSGTATPTLAGYKFTPPSTTYTNVISNQTTNYTANPTGQKDDLVGTWDGQGVYIRNSDSGLFTPIATPATEIAVGDIDGDKTGDLMGIWPGQGGVWSYRSTNKAWTQSAATADSWIAAADMNGDGGDELVGSWLGQGVYWRNNTTGDWTQLATSATQIAAGDLDHDGKADLIGIGRRKAVYG